MERNALLVKRFLWIVAAFYALSIPAFIYIGFHFTVLSLSLLLLMFGILESAALALMCFFIEPDHYPDTDEQDLKYLETLAKIAMENPKKLKSRISNIRMQGNLYLLFLFVSLVEGSAGLILLAQSMFIPKIILFTGVFITGAIIITIFRSLLYKPDFPEYFDEMVATAENFPNLLKLVESLRVSCHAPAIHYIFVEPGESCSVELHSDFFGFRKRNLMHIGLTLLMYCSVEELSAIIAHEFSHIRKQDTLIGYQAYISRVRWEIVRELVETKNFYIRHLLGRFSAFYTDYIAMNFQALSKPKEIEADMLAKKIVGQAACVSALLKVHLLSCIPKPKIDFFDIPSYDDLPSQTFSSHLNGIAGFHLPASDGFIAGMAEKKSAPLDTHPSLYERLMLIGWKGSFDELKIEKNKSMDPGIFNLIDFFDKYFDDQLSMDYDEHLESVEENEEIVEEYDGAMEVADDCMKVGWALFRLHRWEETLVFLQNMDTEFPGNDVLRYPIACTRLHLGMEDAIPELIKLTDDYPYLIGEIVEEISEFIDRTGNTELQDNLEGWLDEKSVIWREHQRELGEIRSRDVFIAASVPSNRILKPFKEELSKHKRIKGVYLLRKKVRYAEKGPLLVGIDVGFANTSKKDVEIVEELLDDMMPELPYEGYIIRTYEQDPRFFLKHFLGPKGNVVYNRRLYIKDRKGISPELEREQEMKRQDARNKYKSRLKHKSDKGEWINGAK